MSVLATVQPGGHSHGREQPYARAGQRGEQGGHRGRGDEAEAPDGEAEEQDREHDEGDGTPGDQSERDHLRRPSTASTTSPPAGRWGCRKWFYKWKNRIGQETPTARECRRADLEARTTRLFEASGGTYGSPQITRDLHEAGWRMSENTVAAWMAELGLIARQRGKPPSLTCQGKRHAAPDLVRRKFTAPAPDVLWCGDVTMIDTDEGNLYLATVEDLFSRRLLGYAMSQHHNAALTCATTLVHIRNPGDDTPGPTLAEAINRSDQP
ncbi:IS3 family transposase [Acrocarpospora sp. B8E8]|uniref:IS3 family transposase n=1 Tax=Acrocarpospora sp. B8E8 TaxID=3153572 RepID=UPI00325F56C3